MKYFCVFNFIYCHTAQLPDTEKRKLKKDSGQDFYLVLYDSFKKANIKGETHNRYIFKRKQLITPI